MFESSMTAQLLQVCIKFSAFGNLPVCACRKQSSSSYGLKLLRPANSVSLSTTAVCSAKGKGFPIRFYSGPRWSFLGGRTAKDLNFLKDERWGKRAAVVVRFNQRYGFNGGGGGGGGGKDDGANVRILGNLALAIGLTYLSMTGQLAWLLDAIVSIWLFVVLLPIVGLGAFLWWAGRDIVRSSCPNCRNEFQIFKSSLNDELQLCPFCSQPFSVVGNRFVKEAVNSNQSASSGQAFNGFSPGSRRGKDSSSDVVDIDAEVIDAE